MLNKTCTINSDEVKKDKGSKFRRKHGHPKTSSRLFKCSCCCSANKCCNSELWKVSRNIKKYIKKRWHWEGYCIFFTQHIVNINICHLITFSTFSWDEDSSVCSAPNLTKREAGKAERRKVKTAEGETICTASCKLTSSIFHLSSLFYNLDWQVAVVVTCQSQVSPALKHTLLYRLFYSKLDHNLLNEHHAVLKKTWN